MNHGDSAKRQGDGPIYPRQIDMDWGLGQRSQQPANSTERRGLELQAVTEEREGQKVIVIRSHYQKPHKLADPEMTEASQAHSPLKRGGMLLLRSLGWAAAWLASVALVLGLAGWASRGGQASGALAAVQAGVKTLDSLLTPVPDLPAEGTGGRPAKPPEQAPSAQPAAEIMPTEIRPAEPAPAGAGNIRTAPALPLDPTPAEPSESVPAPAGAVPTAAPPTVGTGSIRGENPPATGEGKAAPPAP